MLTRRLPVILSASFYSSSELIGSHNPPPPDFLNGGFTQKHTRKYNSYTFQRQTKRAMYQEGIYEIILLLLLLFLATIIV